MESFEQHHTPNTDRRAGMSKQINGVYWIKHYGSWFGFNEPAEVVAHAGGAYFASKHTGERVTTMVLGGLKEPK
jgi:hypothetical protein